STRQLHTLPVPGVSNSSRSRAAALVTGAATSRAKDLSTSRTANSPANPIFRRNILWRAQTASTGWSFPAPDVEGRRTLAVQGYWRTVRVRPGTNRLKSNLFFHKTGVRSGTGEKRIDGVDQG